MDQARLEDLVMAAAERPSGKNLDKLLTELRALPGGLTAENTEALQLLWETWDEDNLFPNQMVGGSTAALEEERRLFYVAVTRAKKYCYLSFARSRFRFGKMEFGNPSRFLNDIAPEYIVMEQKEMGIGRSSSFTERESYSRPVSFRQSANDFESSGRPVKPATRISGLKPLQKKTVQPENAENQVRKPASSVVTTHTADGRTVSNGMMIEHERFGIGKIVNLEGSGENTKATVEFQNIGTKQLLLRFARFRIIEN